MPYSFHIVFGPFTAFLGAFLLPACIYACFALSGLFGAYTRFPGVFSAVAICFRPVSRFPVSGAAWPVSLPSSGAGLIYAGGACFAAWIISRRGFSSGAGRLLPVCFHSAFGRRGACFGCRRRRFSIVLSACFRGRGRGFSIMFPGLFMIPGAAGRINNFSAAGAGKSQKNANEQIFTSRAAHAYAPAYARPRPCTRATPRTSDFSLTHGEGKTGQIYSIRTRA